jgi:hypothetical protein
LAVSMGAPSEALPDQLREAHIRVVMREAAKAQ